MRCFLYCVCHCFHGVSSFLAIQTTIQTTHKEKCSSVSPHPQLVGSTYQFPGSRNQETGKLEALKAPESCQVSRAIATPSSWE
ncbi:hypothetical protein EDB83DRAFT_2380649 [Lactarius deliciosus]|nr:hypothetical protein EDB83DRAFT_2380649 [Lactarius deliciosus]